MIIKTKKYGFTLIELSISALIISIGFALISGLISKFQKDTAINKEKNYLLTSMNILSKKLEKDIKSGSRVIDSFVDTNTNTTFTRGTNVLIVKIPVINNSSSTVLSTPPYDKFELYNTGTINAYNDILVIEYDVNNGWNCTSSCKPSDYYSVKTANLLYSYFPATSLSGSNSNGRIKEFRRVIANDILNTNDLDERTNPVSGQIPSSPYSMFTYYDNTSAQSTTASNIVQIGIDFVKRKIYSPSIRLTQGGNIKVRLMNYQ